MKLPEFRTHEGTPFLVSQQSTCLTSSPLRHSSLHQACINPASTPHTCMAPTRQTAMSPLPYCRPASSPPHARPANASSSIYSSYSLEQSVSLACVPTYFSFPLPAVNVREQTSRVAIPFPCCRHSPYLPLHIKNLLTSVKKGVGKKKGAVKEKREEVVNTKKKRLALGYTREGGASWVERGEGGEGLFG